MSNNAVQTVSLERFLETLSAQNFQISVNSELDDAYSILEKLGLDTQDVELMSGAIQFRYLITETGEDYKHLSTPSVIEKTLEKIRQDLGIQLPKEDANNLVESCSPHEETDNNPKLNEDDKHKTPDPIKLENPTSPQYIVSI